MLVRARTPHPVVHFPGIPLRGLNPQADAPGIAKFRFAGAPHLLRNSHHVFGSRVLCIGAAEFLSQPAHPRQELLLVALGILGVFRRGHGATEFRLEIVGTHHFRGRKQRARGTVALLRLRLLNRLDDFRHAQGMNLVPGLQHFLFEIEEDFGKARLLFRQREDRLVHHLQAQRGAHALASCVGHTESDVRIVAGFVDGRVRHRFNLQFVRRLDEHQAVVPHRPRIAAEEVGVKVHGPRHFRCGGERQFGLAVFDVQVARQHGLSFLDDIHIRGAPLARGEDPQFDGFSGPIDGALRPQENLVQALASLKFHRLRGVVPFPVSGFNLQRLSARAGLDADDGNSAVVGGHLLVRILSGMDAYVRLGRRTVRIRGEDENLVLQVGDQRAALGNRGDEQRRGADRDRRAASFGVAGGVLHRGLNQHARRALGERAPGEVGGQLEVKGVRPIGAGFARDGTHLKRGDIQARCLNCNLTVLHRFSKEVVGANRARHVVTEPITTLGLVILSREIDSDFEFRQNVSFHIQRDLRLVRGGGAGLTQQGAQVVSAQVHLRSEAEFRRGNSELVGLGGLFENLVPAGVFHLKGQRAVAGRLMVGAVQRQGAHVDGLTRLVEGLFGGNQNGNLVFQPHRLGEFRRTDGRVHNVVQLVTAHQSGGEPEPRFRGPAPIQPARKKRAGLFIGSDQFDSHRPAGDDLILRIRDDDAHRRLAARQIGLLAQDVNDRSAENLRYGFRALERLGMSIVVIKAVAQAVPHQVLERQGLRKLDLLLPPSLPLLNLEALFRAPQDFALRVQNFHSQLSRAGMSSMERNGHA